LVAPDGVIATGEATSEIVLTQQEKLDLITITQSVNLDTVEADTASNKTAVDLIATGSPAYIIVNDSTTRVLDANAAEGAISVSPTQAQVENLRDSQLNSDDVLSTMQKDLKAKGMLG
jgi:DNA-binding beta-propeller fold protein YncE